jgi:SecD/SecF fusion protein
LASRRSHLFLVALLLAALVGVGLLGYPSSPYHRSLREGLDLQGGLEVVLQAAAETNGVKLTSADMSRSISIMRNRVDKLGVSEPQIQQQGSNQIVIQLPAVHNQDQAAAIIGKTAQLELYDLTPSLLPPSIDASENPVYETTLFDLLSRVQHSSIKGPAGPYYLFRTKGKKQLKGPSATRALLLKSTKGKVPKGDVVLFVPPKAVVITCDSTVATGCPYSTTGIAPTPGVTYYYLFKHGSYPHDDENPYPQMTGNDLKLTGTQQDFDPQSGEPIVTLQFTSHGDKQFAAITKAEAQRGAALGVEQSFAIVLDDQLYSFPVIDYNQNPTGINPTGTGAEINGMASLSEAKNLALVLQTGALPVKFTTVERTDISATLGKDSLKQARNAAIGGLIVVMVFLLLLYRFLGVVAVIGLGIYAAFMYAAILLFGVTLTLPGFAGLILTIGVAADANVVIFERIKEEGRSGKSVRAAIAAGYAKGFRTIVDANVVTCITALVLFGFATAEVKGFALMLLIGTVVSLITAVAATRAMLGLLAGFSWFNDKRFMGASAAEIPRWQRIDVTGRRRFWFIISLVAIVLSVISLATKGLNLGIDFKGGVQMTLVTKNPTSLNLVRSVTSAAGQPDAVVQGQGKSTNSGNDFTRFQIQVKKLASSEQSSLENTLSSKAHAQIRSVTSVSGSFSNQILKGAITSILVSFLLIALYVTLRYQWRFAVPILRTLLNDIPIALGVYSISGREVTASTVAAMLTILGYSVYDTIIVFDRVRENMRLMPRASIATIANISVAEVLKRSIVTSVITLLPIIALFGFGGSTLRDFAFAIMVGISIGAVSTIFVATPLLTSLIERNPEYARRKGDVLLAGHQSGAAALREAERVAAAQATPLTPMDEVEREVEHVVEAVTPNDASQDAKRERRKKRRQSRPHGRPR